MEARLAYKEMIAALRESADEENESDCTSSKISNKESNLQDPGKAPSPESDEEVPNYSKFFPFVCSIFCLGFRTKLIYLIHISLPIRCDFQTR